MIYIYILYSASADKFYIGHSSDPWKRLKQHLDNPSDKYTGKYRDWELKAVFQVGDDRGEAIRIEKFIKKQKSRKLVQHMVDGNELSGILAQLVRVPYVRD